MSWTKDDHRVTIRPEYCAGKASNVMKIGKNSTPGILFTGTSGTNFDRISTVQLANWKSSFPIKAKKNIEKHGGNF